MRSIVPLTVLLFTFGCAESAPGPGPMSMPPGGGDAGLPSGGALLDTSVLGELDDAQRVALCEENFATQLAPTQQQVCTVEALYDAADATACVTARDACIAETWESEGAGDCATGSSYLAQELEGCGATVAQYRACRAELDAVERQMFEVADCAMHAGNFDALLPSEEPASCATLWASCPDVFNGTDEG